MKTLTVTGLSHHTSPVALRERLAFPKEVLPKALLRLRELFPDGGVVILSTCNRVEVYVSDLLPATDQCRIVRDFLAQWHGFDENEFAFALYELQDEQAVGHLFRVASGLDSMVLGEAEILGQVHDAYLTALAENTTDKIISAVFQRAFKLAKDVRTRTQIGAGKVSVASVAVDLAVSIFQQLHNKVVMIVGAGENGELILKHLLSRGVAQVLIVNRSVERAQEVAERYGGTAYSLTELGTLLPRADIVITSVGAGEALLHTEHVQSALTQRDGRPVLIIDLGVPRNVNPAVADLDNVYLYDIDHLQEIAERNTEARRAEIERCVEIIEEHVERFMKWLHSLQAEPTIISIRREFHEIREQELAKTFAALPDLTPEQRAEIEYMTKRIVNNILQRPLNQLREFGGREDSHRMLHLIKRLFGLEEGAR